MTPVGLEPTPPEGGDFKSPVSANSTTGPGEIEGEYTICVEREVLWRGNGVGARAGCKNMKQRGAARPDPARHGVCDNGE